MPEAPLETPLPLVEAAPADDFGAGVALRSLDGAKLAASLFLHNFCMGSWFVTLGNYVKSNAGDQGMGIFSPGFVGAAYGAGPLAAMVSPFVTGMLADRYFRAEQLMALLSVLCAIAMACAVAATSQPAFFAALAAYFFCYHPSYALANSIALHHLREPRRTFPVVRAWGTIGWIAAGVFVGALWPRFTGGSIESTATPMKICVGATLATAVLSIWMPQTLPARHTRRPQSRDRIDPRAAHHASSALLPELLRDRQFIALMVLGVAAHIPSQFYYAYSNVYFNWTGMNGAAAKMTLGQVVEVGVMLSMPLVLAAISVKAAIMTGLGVWTLRYLMMAAAAPVDAMGRDVLLYAAIMLHGLAFTLVTISLQLEVDRCAGSHRRSTAQGLFSAAVQGFGCFSGAQLAGIAGVRLLPAPVNPGAARGWSFFWLCGAAGSGLVLALTAAILRSRAKK